MSKAASDLAKQRKRQKKTCPGCGEKFDGLAVQTYCSNRCRQRAFRQKNKH